jgi:hypothetical protein
MSQTFIKCEQKKLMYGNMNTIKGITSNKFRGFKRNNYS